MDNKIDNILLKKAFEYGYNRKTAVGNFFIYCVTSHFFLLFCFCSVLISSQMIFFFHILFLHLIFLFPVSFLTKIFLDFDKFSL